MAFAAPLLSPLPVKLSMHSTPPDSSEPESAAAAPPAPSSRSRCWRRLGLGGAILLLWSICSLWGYAVGVGPHRYPAEILVDIPPNVGFRGVEKVLAEQGVIAADFRFRILAGWLGLRHRLKAGEYLFKAGESPRGVLRALVAGVVVRHPLTVVEGANLYQVADLLVGEGWGGAAEFLALSHDRNFIAELGLHETSLEGYLFPDTYYLKKGQSLKAIMRMMVSRWREEMGRLALDPTLAGAQAVEIVLPGDRAEGGAGEERLTLSLHELLTLASIVEKETAIGQERPLIARVFYNRLQSKMRLQTDPTVNYGLRQFTAPLTRVDLATATPYNTYLIPALPPGPICNPGRAAVAAVLRPAAESYYYFVAQGDGSHFFSKTLAEHNQAVSRYRAWQRGG